MPASDIIKPEKAINMGEIREPIVSNQFYRGTKEELLLQIEQCFLDTRFGVGVLPRDIEASKEEALGVVSPHAGYVYSGMAQSHSYAALAATKTSYRSFLILGLSHRGYFSALSLTDWKTPLGVLKNDQELGKALAQTGIPIDERVHKQEHSLEVQIPFLQFIFGDSAKIVPLIVSDDMTLFEITEKIVSVLKDFKGEKIGLIASSDFTHYGLNFGFLPFKTREAATKMKELDGGAIDYLLKLDSEGFLEYIERTGATICGRKPIACLTEVCRQLGATKAELNCYYTSGDIIHDYSSAVGYASISYY
ncbi:MAG: AmmeMemoRadiSam system protein B [Promethearchaeota archaeon]